MPTLRMTTTQSLALSDCLLRAQAESNRLEIKFPTESRNVPSWLFMNAAFLIESSTARVTSSGLRSMTLTRVDSALVSTKIIPFVYGGNHRAVPDEYNAVLDDARMIIYHTVMFLGGPLSPAAMTSG